MLDEITSDELSEWEAFDRIEGIGDWKEDYRLAFLSSLFVNVNRRIHDKKGSKMTTPEDFLITWGADRLQKEDNATQQQSMEEMKNILFSMASKQKKTKKKTRR